MKNFIINYKQVLNKQFIIIYLLYFSFFIIHWPLENMLSILLISKGFDESFYGLIISIINVIHIFLPVFIGFISLHKNTYIISMIAIICGVLVCILVAFTESNLLIISGAIFIACIRTIFNFSLGNKINYSIIEKNKSKYFAIRDLFLFGASSIGLILGSFIVSRFSINFLYAYGGIGYIIPVFVICSMFRLKRKLINNDVIKDTGSKNKSKVTMNVIKQILKNKRFWAYLAIQLFTCIYSVSMQFIPFLAISIGLSITNIMQMLGFMTFINAVIALYLSYKADNSGRKWFYVLDLAYDCIPALIFAFTNNIYLFILGVIIGMIKDVFAPISFAYFYDIFDDENGNMILSIVSSLSNVLGSIIPIMIGLIWRFSNRLVFIIGAIGCFMAAIIAILFLPNMKGKK